jgi:peptidoglycan/LPS O-acetylase OafA/YrhL
MVKKCCTPVVLADNKVDSSQHHDHLITIDSGRRILQRLAYSLVPSFVQRSLRFTSIKSPRIHPTSYLDGLRGVASFLVFMGHYTEENMGWYTEPYGLYEDGAPSSPLQLPFIRVIYSGRPMVHIFFIISGYVLSYKPLKQIHSQQYSALATTLSSAVFRRAVRLFLPSIIMLFVMAIAVQLGISDERYAPSLPLLSQAVHWWTTCWSLLCSSWAIGGESQPAYNPALWTIPIEFTQSLLLFVVILGLSRCLRNVRLVLLACIMVFCFRSGQLYTVEFLGGFLIAEFTLIQDSSLFTPSSSPSSLPSFSFDGTTQKERPMAKSVIAQMFWIANIICGLFIASWTNNHVGGVWGIKFLNAHTPYPYSGQKAWFCLGAFQIVAACTQLSYLQSMFTTRVAQYLGNISYALYLTHNLCLTTLEPRMAQAITQLFGNETFWGRHLTWLLGLVLYMPVIICVADFFWRAVDIPSVKLARWLETKCIVTPKKT